MIRVFVLYLDAPDPDRYEQHVELNRREVLTATIRHGRILGTPQGESDIAYYFGSTRTKGFDKDRANTIVFNAPTVHTVPCSVLNVRV